MPKKARENAALDSLLVMALSPETRPDGMTLRFVVPGEPVTWQRAGSRGKRRFTPTECETYQARVRQLGALAMVQARLEPLKGPVLLVVRCTFRHDDPKKWGLFADTDKRDADNVAKGIADALEGRKGRRPRTPTCFVNDRQVCVWSARKLWGDVPGAEVFVRSLAQEWKA